MKKKLPWLKYDMKKTEYLNAQKREKDAKKNLDEAAKKLNDFKAPIEYVLVLMIVLITWAFIYPPVQNILLDKLYLQLILLNAGFKCHFLFIYSSSVRKLIGCFFYEE